MCKKCSVIVSEISKEMKYPTIKCTKDDGSNIWFPWFCITNFAVVKDLSEDGFPKIGSTLFLEEQEDGRYYPDPDKYTMRRPPIRTHLPKRRMSEESLRENLVPYNPLSLNDLWECIYQSIQNFPQKNIKEAFMTRDLPENLQRKELCRILNLNDTGSIPAQEDVEVEFKSSFCHSAQQSKKERMVQYHKIFNTISAMANSEKHRGRIYVGVDDRGNILDLTTEMLQDMEFKTRNDMEADFKNILGLYIKNITLAQSIVFSWHTTKEEKIFCIIEIPDYKGPIVFSGSTEDVYVRLGSSNKKLTGPALAEFIASRYIAN